jgi:2Fe-2S ferredoxin
MPVISFSKKNRNSLTVEAGANLMKSLLSSEIPVASSCHGDGVCAKCKLQVTQGQQNLSKPNDIEIFLKQKFQLKSDQRISCQAQVLGDIEVDTTYW